MSAARERDDAPPPAPPLDDNLHQRSWDVAQADALGHGPGTRTPRKENARPAPKGSADAGGGAQHDGVGHDETSDEVTEPSHRKE